MTVQEAFKQLSGAREWYKLCNVTPDAARSAKRNFSRGKLSEEKMRVLLTAAGYQEQPAVWTAPTVN